MRHIQKGPCPYAYLRWCKRVAGTNKEDYRELSGNEKQAMLAAMIKQQGGLCGYTMRRIDDNSAHVEHIKPQRVCRAERRGADLDYKNLLACFPRENMNPRYRYGAQHKGGWWEDGGRNFVSPLHPACEKRFRFDLSGRIAPVNGHQAATTTIRVLALDHPSLREDRKRAIEEFIYGRSGDAPLSVSQASTAQTTIVNRNRDGHFREFCIAIRDALTDHLRTLQTLARQRRFARRRN